MKYHSCSSELKLTTILFGLAIFLCGCSTSYLVSSTGKPDAEYSYREMNEELKGRNVKIALKDGRDIFAKEVKISDDTVSWVGRQIAEESKASIREINKIVMKSDWTGALEGTLMGLLGGGGVGAILGGGAAKDNGGWGTGFATAMGSIIGGGIGMIVGLITGSIIGHRYNYVFPAAEPSDSLQHSK